MGFHPWVRKIPWRRKWQPTPVFLSVRSRGQRSLAGYSPWGHKESDTTEHAHTCTLKYLRVQCHDVWMMYSVVRATPWIVTHQAYLPPKFITVCSNSCPLSRWCSLTISSSAALFSFCLLSFPASGSFPMSHLFASCCQSIGASASARVLPGNIQGWFSLGLTVLMSLQSKGLSRVSSSTSIQ